MKTESIIALSDSFSSRESSGFLKRLFLKKVDLEEHALLLEVALAELEDSFLRQKKGTAARLSAQISAKLVATSATSSILLGAAGLFGTASTGTAIGALSGAAYTSAALAWIGGSVAAGTAIVGAASLAVGIAVVPLVGVGWRRYISGKERAAETLTEQEFQIKLALDNTLVALKANKQTELGLLQAWKHMILPICGHLRALQQSEYKEWAIRDKRRLDKSLRKVERLASKVDKKLSERAILPVSAVGAFLFKVFSESTKWNQTDHLVMSAIVRSTTELDESSTENEIGDYIRQCAIGPSRDGLINNIKGIYHELAYAAVENSDGDDWNVELSQKTNEPGIDAYLVNSVSGERLPIQLKSSGSGGVVDEHYESHPNIPVYGTSGLASNDARVTDSGFQNSVISEDVSRSVEKLSHEGTLADGLQEAATVASTSAFIAMTLTFGQALRSGHTLDKSASRSLDSAKRAAGFAALSTTLSDVLL